MGLVILDIPKRSIAAFRDLSAPGGISKSGFLWGDSRNAGRNQRHHTETGRGASRRRTRNCRDDRIERKLRVKTNETATDAGENAEGR